MIVPLRTSPFVTRADLIALRDATITIRERFRKMVKDGMTLEQVKAARPTKEFDQRFALQNVGRNEIVSTDAWYGIMYNGLRTGSRRAVLSGKLLSLSWYPARLLKP